MDDGGNCFIHGGFLTSKIDPNRNDSSKMMHSFVTDYLHVKYIDQKERPVKITGADGDVLTKGLDFQIKKDGFSTTILEPLEGAVPIFYYPSGEVAGIRYEGKYKLVFLAFGFVDIESLETRKILINRILDWFDK